MAARSLKLRVDGLLELGRSIHRERPDLQDAFPDPESLPYWIWLQTHGIRDYPEVREASVPLPPTEIQSVVNVGDWFSFLLNGASSHQLLLRVLADQGLDLADVGPILDFGCGPGRCLRFFLRRSRDVSFVGIDVDPASVRWCQANFPFGEFHVNPERPPTRLASAAFGFVYAISVFSHLSEENHVDWLRELARLSRPGALLVLTVHGKHALDRARNEEFFFRMVGMPLDDLDRAHSTVERHGFAFVSQPEGHLNRSLYGLTFLSEDYVRRTWSSEFEVVRYEHGALDAWQDAVVLRRKA